MEFSGEIHALDINLELIKLAISGRIGKRLPVASNEGGITLEEL